MFDYGHLKALLDLLKELGYRHTTVSPATHKIINVRVRNALAKNIVDILGWSRPFLEYTISENLFSYMSNANILEKQGNVWLSKIRVSTIGNQYFIHSAFPTTHTNAIFFGPDTYRFVHALKHYFSQSSTPIGRAVDICTGCGPAAIQMAKTFPKADIWGVDINDLALEFAKFNSSINHLNNIQFLNSNILQDIHGDFDFITANPPYLVDASKRSYRHGGGLYGYQLSLDIIDSALPRLNPGGSLLLYTGVAIVEGRDYFFDEVASKLSGTAFTYEYEEVDPDIFADELLVKPYHQADRIAAVVLIVRKPLTSIAKDGI